MNMVTAIDPNHKHKWKLIKVKKNNKFVKATLRQCKICLTVERIIPDNQTIELVIERLKKNFKPCRKEFHIDCSSCRYGRLLLNLLEEYLEIINMNQ